MQSSNRRLVMGSIQPLLFCIGMYFVVLLFSVFVCSSIYHAVKSHKKANVQAKMVSAATASAPHVTISMNK
ncbi:MAG: hypothetical protein M9933_06955 [Chitinophagaceae bacterium]|nr:hypothetical protein [Chitinophagaceae bacterium]